MTADDARLEQAKPAKRPARKRAPKKPARLVDLEPELVAAAAAEQARGTHGELAAEVERALVGVPDDWRTALVRTLVGQITLDASAALVRELRLILTELIEEKPPKERTAADAIRERRKARIASPADQ